jgi:nucleoside-diphosphate-sugar epimerase
VNILLIGGAGYLGSQIFEHLRWKGPDFMEDGLVVIADSLIHNQGPLVFPHWPNYQTFWRQDIDELSEETLSKFDVIFPLAALVGAPLCDKDSNEAWRVNTYAIRRLMKKLSPNQRVIFPMTNSGYGIQSEICTEETPMKSISVYGQSKEEAEKIIMEHPKATSFRLATLYGLSWRPRIDLMVNDFTYRAVINHEIPLFEGDFLRNFVHCGDVARIMVDCVTDERTFGQVFNLGRDEENTTKYKLAETIKGELARIGEEVKITHLDQQDKDRRNYNVSSAKLAKLGYKAGVGLTGGIWELIRFYKTFPTVGTKEHESLIGFMRNA